MAILIGALEFEGPQTEIDMLSDIAGIYAVLCESGGEYELIDIADADYVREHIVLRSDRQQWEEDGLSVSYAVHYTPDLTPEERREIKESLEREFADPVAA